MIYFDKTKYYICNICSIIIFKYAGIYLKIQVGTLFKEDSMIVKKR